MTQGHESMYRVWDTKKQMYFYYDEYPKNENSHYVFKNTMIKENIHEKSENNRFIYEGDHVNIRAIDERFNCGGDNTIDNTGLVVWKDNAWQLYCQLETEFSYIHNNDYYVSLEQSNTKRMILQNSSIEF